VARSGRKSSKSDQPLPRFADRPFAPTTRTFVTSFADAAAGRSITASATTSTQGEYRQIIAMRLYARARDNGQTRGLCEPPVVGVRGLEPAQATVGESVHRWFARKGYDLAFMEGRHFASLAAVAVAILAALTLVSSAAATRQAAAHARFAAAKTSTAVVIDPAAGAVLLRFDSRPSPAKSGTAVVIDPTTGAVLRFAASRPSPAKSGTAVVIDPATGAIVRIR
jgi:methionine-rich copper-binding protein CopC